MKKSLLSLLMLAQIVVFGQSTIVNLSMTPGYSQDVYYSFPNGVQKSEANGNWQLAFGVEGFTAAIRINEAHGVKLYKVANDTASFATADTTNMIADSLALWNAESDWDYGAFNKIATGHPDYGWGTYNSLNHDVNGTKTFVISVGDTLYKKFYVRKMAANGNYTFRIADLDGANDQVVSFSKATYNTKNFIYYDLFNNVLVDREPAKSDWDIVFTRYKETVQGTEYTVSGVMTNVDLTSARIEGVDTPNASATINDFVDANDNIGSDWKYFSMSTFSWMLTDSLTYFVESKDGNIYRLIFKGFVGTSSGDITFVQEQVSSLSADENESIELSVYPNPATDFIKINLASEGTLFLTNMSGMTVKNQNLSMGENKVVLNGLPAGTYIARVIIDGTMATRTLIIK